MIEGIDSAVVQYFNSWNGFTLMTVSCDCCGKDVSLLRARLRRDGTFCPRCVPLGESDVGV